jgi:outer membrane protein assembly factor BamD
LRSRRAATGVGVEVVSAPAADPNAVLKPVGPNTVAPAAEKPAEAPTRSTTSSPARHRQRPAADAKKKKPKADLNDESSSKKKKKKGLSKLNPF